MVEFNRASFCSTHTSLIIPLTSCSLSTKAHPFGKVDVEYLDGILTVLFVTIMSLAVDVKGVPREGPTANILDCFTGMEDPQGMLMKIGRQDEDGILDVGFTFVTVFNCPVMGANNI